DTLMSFARAKPPGKQKLSLKELLVETVSEMERVNGIEVVWQLDEAVPPVYADREQLARVFHNLIRNGIEAMPDGGRLFVSTAVAGTAVIITIKDTGVGIPPENQAQLFEPLFTTKSNGIGLGLALVRSLVEAHGGEIAVESQVEKGSAFKVRLPAAAEE
ncbi:MAG: PAS domain-containing sensor histidine kinase, partial [Anaerolineae bacterium]